MDRIRRKAEKKKIEEMKRKAQVEKLVEKAREQVLGEYSIKTVN